MFFKIKTITIRPINITIVSIGDRVIITTIVPIIIKTDLISVGKVDDND